jgi:hypothetical protein
VEVMSMSKNGWIEQPDVLCCGDVGFAPLQALLSKYGMEVVEVALGVDIPGSYWGTSEAGLLGNQLLVREDTPIHSALHEACHYICMDDLRRCDLDTDAGGAIIEENGVCYLQILLADFLPPLMNRAQMLADMDAWGYTFRLGSAQAWFEQDADDAREWLVEHQLLDADLKPIWNIRH